MDNEELFEGSVDALFPAGKPGAGQPLETTYELQKLQAEELKKKRARDKELEAEAMAHSESTNYIGYDPLPDLPYQEPKSIGWDDPQYSRKENKTKGAASGPYLTVPLGAPRSRDNQSRNPARQLYGSTQGSSYSKDDPRRFFALDPSLWPREGNGEILADTNWQSGKSDNQMIYDHACENAGYWTTNGGPYCNYRNFNITSGDGGGKPYKPATLEAETKRGNLTMLYNLGHGTMRATPEGYDMNIIGASGYIRPVADKNQNSKDANVVCSLNVAHMYIMYRSDLTNEEFEQLADDIENSPIGDIHEAFNSDNPFRIFTDDALRQRLSKKVPYSPYRETYINVLAKLIGNATKRRSPDTTAMMRLFKAGELTYLTAIEWFVENCAHVVTEKAWFRDSGLSLEDLLNGKSYLVEEDLRWKFEDYAGGCDFTELISSYGKKPNKPGSGNKPNRPNHRPGSGNAITRRDKALAAHSLKFPTCKGPPCNHLGRGPDYINNPDLQRKSWPEVLWTRWHDKEHPDCKGKWTAGNQKGQWCPHLPGGYHSAGNKDTWDRLNEKQKKRAWEKYHTYLYGKAGKNQCLGTWEPQRNLFPTTGGYCHHHPKCESFTPGIIEEHKEQVKQELIEEDPRFKDIFDARDKGENIINIEKPNTQKPGDWKKWAKDYFDSLGSGDYKYKGNNGASLEVKKGEDNTEIKFKNEDKPIGKDRDFTVSKDKDNNVSLKGNDVEISQKTDSNGDKITEINLKDDNKHTVTEGDDGTVKLETEGPDGKKQTVTKDKDDAIKIENEKGDAEIKVNEDGSQDIKVNTDNGDKLHVNVDGDGGIEADIKNGNYEEIHLKADDEGVRIDVGDDIKIDAQQDESGKINANIETDNGNAEINRDGSNAEIKVERDDAPDLNANIITDEDGNNIGTIHIEAEDGGPGETINIHANQDGSGGIGISGDLDDEQRQNLEDHGFNVTTEDGITNINWDGETDWPEAGDPDYPGLRPEYPDLFPNRPDERPEGGLPDRPEGGTGGGVFPNRPDLDDDANFRERIREFIRLNGPITGDNGITVDVNDRGEFEFSGINASKDDIANNNPNIDRDDLDGPIPIPGGNLIWDDVTGKVTWTPNEPDQVPDEWKDAGYPGFHLNLKDPNSDKEVNAWLDGDGNLIIDGKPAGDITVDEDLKKEIKELINIFREKINDNRPGLSFEDLSPENQKKWKEKLKEWQDKFHHLDDVTDKIDSIKKAWDWITFLEQFGEIGMIIGIVVGGIKGLISTVGSAWSQAKSMDYLGELSFSRTADECSHFPMLIRQEEKTKWTDFYPKYFNKEVNGVTQAMAQLLCCRFNGYLIDCNTVEKNSASISRIELSYLTPTYGLGLSASDYDHPYYRALPRAYPDPGRRYGTANYDSNPRRGESTSLKVFRDHISTQAEWTEICDLQRSYWQPDMAQIIIGPDKQYDFKTQGGLTKRTGTLEVGWSEIWRTSGFMNHDDCAGFYQQNIFSEHGFGIFCDVNYRSDDSSHATWLELSTNDPKPWPFVNDSDFNKPRLTMDLENLQLNSGSIHQKTSKTWQLAEVILNFFDERGTRRAIPLSNYEGNWENRMGGKGYKFHSGTIGDEGSKHQFYHHSLKKQQDWGDAGNTNHARCPLHLSPTNTDYQSWFNANCTFIGFSISMWPLNQSQGTDSDSVIGVGGKSWKACLFKRLRFVKEFPTEYPVLFPPSVTSNHDW